MVIKMAVKKFIQLVDIPDYRYEKNCVSVDYGQIAEDCDTKTISLLEAIKELSLNIFSMTDEKTIDNDKISSLSAIIYDLTEIAIATNKISQTSSFLAGVKESERDSQS
jgi:hypothetical protein